MTREKFQRSVDLSAPCILNVVLSAHEQQDFWQRPMLAKANAGKGQWTSVGQTMCVWQIHNRLPLKNFPHTPQRQYKPSLNFYWDCFVNKRLNMQQV